MDKLRINPKFKDLIPPLLPKEYAGLEELIKTEGIRDALIAWNGVIVDGHNRFEIAERHGITDYKITEMDFPNEAAAMMWIIDTQLGRRNLSKLDRIELANKRKPLYREKGKEKQREAGGAVRQKSDKAAIDTKKELADLAGVSHDTFKKGEEILANATPELIQEVREGKKKINRAYREMQTGTIVCKKCGEEKPTSKASVERKSLCMDCENEHRREVIRARKEKSQEGEEAPQSENMTMPTINELSVADAVTSNDTPPNDGEPLADENIPAADVPLINEELQTGDKLLADDEACADKSEDEGKELPPDSVGNAEDAIETTQIGSVPEPSDTTIVNAPINPNYTIEAFQLEFMENANSYIELAKRFITGHYSPLWKQQENKSIAIAALDEVITAMKNLKGTIEI